MFLFLHVGKPSSVLVTKWNGNQVEWESSGMGIKWNGNKVEWESSGMGIKWNGNKVYRGSCVMHLLRDVL